MTEYIENPLSGKLRGVTYEDGKIIDVHIRDTDDVVKIFVPMASEKEATGMMDVREKLIDLLTGHSIDTQQDVEYVADHLISNGVTVQEWISVDDRLPEEKGRYLTANKRYGDKIVVFDLWFGGGFWYVEEEDDVFDFEVTHWMPMPNPPKGEERKDGDCNV